MVGKDDNNVVEEKKDIYRFNVIIIIRSIRKGVFDNNVVKIFERKNYIHI